jgi:hypothetical protein
VKRLAVLGMLIPALALALVGIAQAKSPLYGVYQVTIKGSAAQLNGTWQISFAPNGAYVVVKAPNTKTMLIGGSSSTSGATVKMTDKSGPAACTGNTATARYKWSVSGKSLKLTKVKDACAPRAVILATAPLTKVG